MPPPPGCTPVRISGWSGSPLRLKFGSRSGSILGPFRAHPGPFSAHPGPRISRSQPPPGGGIPGRESVAGSDKCHYSP